MCFVRPMHVSVCRWFFVRQHGLWNTSFHFTLELSFFQFLLFFDEAKILSPDWKYRSGFHFTWFNRVHVKEFFRWKTFVSCPNLVVRSNVMWKSTSRIFLRLLLHFNNNIFCLNSKKVNQIFCCCNNARNGKKFRKQFRFARKKGSRKMWKRDYLHSHMKLRINSANIILYIRTQTTEISVEFISIRSIELNNL